MRPSNLSIFIKWLSFSFNQVRRSPEEPVRVRPTAFLCCVFCSVVLRQVMRLRPAARLIKRPAPRSNRSRSFLTRPTIYVIIPFKRKHLSDRLPYSASATPRNKNQRICFLIETVPAVPAELEAEQKLRLLLLVFFPHRPKFRSQKNPPDCVAACLTMREIEISRRANMTEWESSGMKPEY